MRNKKLNNFITNINKTIENNNEKIASNNYDNYQKVHFKFENEQVRNDRYMRILHNFIRQVPEDKFEQLGNIYKTVLGWDEKEFQERKDRAIKKYNDSSAKSIGLLLTPADAVDKMMELYEGIEKLLDDKVIDEIIDEEQSKISPLLDILPIHPYQEIVDQIKQGEKFNALDKNKKAEVEKQLDEINNLFTQKNKDYISSNIEYEKSYESIRNRENEEIVKNALQTMTYPNGLKLGDVFEFNGNVNIVTKDDVTDNQDKIDIYNSVRFQLSDDAKRRLMIVLNKFEELDLVEAGDGTESGNKEYGFTKVVTAKKAMDKALNDQDFDNLKNVKNAYINEVNKVHEMYNLIKQNVDPNPRRMPGNQDSYRNDDVPGEFKEDMPLNQTYNGLFNTYAIIKKTGVSIQDFVNDPGFYLNQQIEHEATKNNIDIYHQDKTYMEKLVWSYGDDDLIKPYNVYGFPRMVSNLGLFEQDKEMLVKNEVYSESILGTSNNFIQNELWPSNYFKQDRQGTLANTLLARPEDRNFLYLHSYPSKTPDMFHSIPPFDRAKYIQEKNITPQEFEQNITEFVSTLYRVAVSEDERYLREQQENVEREERGEPTIDVKDRIISTAYFRRAMSDVQNAIYEYLMIKNPAENENIQRLKDILKNPTRAFQNMNFSENYVNSMSTLNDGTKILKRHQKQAKKLEKRIIKQTRNAEKSYNKIANRILRALENLNRKATQQQNPRRLEAIQLDIARKLNALKRIQKSETNRLQREYNSGNIPKAYFEKRYNDVLNQNHNEKIILFDDGFNKNTFLQNSGLENLTRAEKKGIINSELERRKAEKTMFFNKLYLVKAEKLPNIIEKVDVKTVSFEQIDINKASHQRNNRQVEIQQPIEQIQVENVVQENQREPIEVVEAEVVKNENKIEQVEKNEPKEIKEKEQKPVVKK